MAVLIIVLAFVLILGSALWVLPSPRQREQMNMRRAAMLKGLLVKLTKIKDLKYPGDETHCIAYRLARQRAQGLKAQAWMLYRHERLDGESSPYGELQIPGWLYDRGEGTYRFDDIQLISELLAQLPEDVMAVQSTGGALSVYWNERGEMDDVDVILRVLTAMQSL